MDLQRIRELAYEHLGNRKAHLEREKGFIYYHGQRVARIAVTLRKMILPDEDSRDEVLTVAAYFHDIAKGIEPHNEYGAVLAREVLKDYCDPQQLEEIAQLIHLHKIFDKSSKQPELAKILQDADILDHFGTIEIWMNFQYSAFLDEPIENSVNFYQGEFDSHAGRIGKLLNYELSRQIYREKIAFVKSFADRMKIESEGGIYCFDSICRG
ncbi:MAG: HD domain-containing protein [Caldicoprobacterales bacterium]